MASQAPGETYDAGAVFARDVSVVKHTFMVVNTTGRTVRIQGEHHSCTCTEVGLEKRALGPNESVPLTLSVRVPDGYSRQNLTCSVETDSPSFPTWDYQLRFESFPPARFTKDRIDLGEAELGGRPPDGVEVWLETYSRKTGGDIPEPRWEPIAAGLAVACDRHPAFDELPGGIKRARYRVHVGTKTDLKTPGMIVSPLNVHVGAGAASALVVCKVVGPLKCEPSRVHFGLVAPGAPAKTVKVLLRSSNGRPFRLVALESASPWVALRRAVDDGTETPAKTSHELQLVLSTREDCTQTVLAGEALVKTDVERFPEVRIPWSVFLRRSLASAAD